MVDEKEKEEPETEREETQRLFNVALVALVNLRENLARGHEDLAMAIATLEDELNDLEFVWEEED